MSKPRKCKHPLEELKFALRLDSENWDVRTGVYANVYWCHVCGSFGSHFWDRTDKMWVLKWKAPAANPRGYIPQKEQG